MLDQPNLDKIDHEHLLMLYEITRTMNSSLDFDEVLNIVMDSMMQVTRAQRGFLMIADENGRLARFRSRAASTATRPKNPTARRLSIRWWRRTSRC